MEKLLVTKREAADALGCSMRTIDNLIAQFKLPSRRLGKRRMIPYEALVLFSKSDTETIMGKEPA